MKSGNRSGQQPPNKKVWSRKMTMMLTIMEVLVVMLFFFASTPANAAACKKADLQPKISPDACRPQLKMKKPTCTKLIAKCRCQHGIMMKWIPGGGCPKKTPAGGSGCQCATFCDLSCVGKCNADKSGNCAWSAVDGKCKNRFTSAVGPVAQCRAPTDTPTRSPSGSPTTSSPSLSPTTSSPSSSPTTSMPSASPSRSPTSSSPTNSPTTNRPSQSPSKTPTTSTPSKSPSRTPTTSTPSRSPSKTPTTSKPSGSPSKTPTTSTPSRSPSKTPTTSKPSGSPSKSPTTSSPTSSPSKTPTTSTPSKSPSRAPSRTPTTSLPSRSPSRNPTTSAPSKSPTTSAPSKSPTTSAPSKSPTTSAPSKSPTTSAPSKSPTTKSPTVCYTDLPTYRLAGGNEHSCGLNGDNNAKCWGLETYGRLGNSQSNPGTIQSSAVTVNSLTSERKIFTGGRHSCAITSSKAVYCWGRNGDRQLGVNGNTDSSTPLQVNLGSGEFAENMCLGNDHTCAVTTAGKVLCWGKNDKRQCGQTGSSDVTTPTQVGASLNKVFVQVACASETTCALTNEGKVYCWGDNDQGELGRGTTDSFSSTPALAVNLDSVTSIAAGYEHFCARITCAGTLKCWGRNEKGQVGTGTAGSKVTSPVSAVSAYSGIVSFSGSYRVTCIVLVEGNARCWGAGNRRGDGSFSDSTTPTAVSGITTAVEVSCGYDHCCILLQNQSIKCFGEGDSGQLGSGSTSDSNTSVNVNNLS